MCLICECRLVWPPSLWVTITAFPFRVLVLGALAGLIGGSNFRPVGEKCPLQSYISTHTLVHSHAPTHTTNWHKHREEHLPFKLVNTTIYSAKHNSVVELNISKALGQGSRNINCSKHCTLTYSLIWKSLVMMGANFLVLKISKK